MSAQNSYAKLLQEMGLGDGMFFPRPDVKIGDVAYFTGSTYHVCFNVFELSPNVSESPISQPAYISRTHLEGVFLISPVVRHVILGSLTIPSL